MEQNWVQITGSVEHIVYANEGSGFAVLELDYEGELLSVVGELFGVEEGEELKLTGSFTSHPKFGRQFKAEAYERRLPATAGAIRKFLASGAVKGIGAVLAGRMVETFGDHTLQVMEQTPERLTEVKGISPKKAEALRKEFRELFGMRSVMMFLTSFGLSPGQCIRAWKRWGLLTQELVSKNPYVLCEDELAVDFKTADRMALGLGLSERSPARIFGAIGYVLRYNLNNGHTCLARSTVISLVSRLLTSVNADDVDIEIDHRTEQEELCVFQHGKEYLALPAYYQAERFIAMRIGLMLQNRHFTKRSIDRMIDRMETEKGISYETLQREAIKQAIAGGIFILTGGPGTGKTTTLNGIIELLEEEGLKVAIAAPTGRAAKRISEVTGRDASTIHRLLEVDFSGRELRFIHDEQNPLPVDVVVIDEMSMVDTLLFEALLRGIRMGCKLILVGDSDQLPSVGAGNVLGDLVKSERIPTVTLTQIFRQAAQSLIVRNAHQIVSGEYPELGRTDGDFFFLQRQSEQTAAQTVIELACQRLPKSYGYSPMNGIQVLTPQRKGELGVYALNNRLQQQLNPPASGKKEYKGLFYTFREGDKVLQTRNNYDLEWTRDNGHGGSEPGAGVYNGDIGLIRSIHTADATMEIDFEDRSCTYPFELAVELELAYAITVHKSQGSEYDAVVLPIYGGYDKLYFRNLLYTAVTRAKKTLVIVGSKARVYQMVDNNIKTLRYTALRFLLNEGAPHENQSADGSA